MHLLSGHYVYTLWMARFIGNHIHAGAALFFHGLVQSRKDSSAGRLSENQINETRNHIFYAQTNIL